ncbi:Outer membrane receptor for ferrienterochelin and colicins [Hyunsoonleella jejuensis]|uniref:Outer membrane receptor for ferrienterochelin and colicins n=1 Tax=Hyunsoonleella jejuensis TaxID=419940 RepID=A0A1H9DE08_9FLAO|nr:TonB-dependent receptor plug domain-containing protein [Hyunsoonleella jejuensis]SEQ11792.1 Outer membrane receptor for ferrienterochelin and colicins [Hyunsoonleella jejuensis]
MNKKGGLFLLSILFFLNGLKGFSQANQETQPLIAILKILSERYDVSFSYIDETIANIEAPLPSEDLELTDAIYELELSTNLKFSILNSRFITIVKREETDKTIIREQLEEVVVKNYLTSGITKLNDGSLTVKPEQFGILPGLIEPDVLQTIQALPGVFSVEESVSNLNIRGGTHDQNLILWDGIKMYQSGHFFGLISAFNPYTTKKVNVSKNGTRARFGDGVSSVIDMQLSNDVDGKFNAGAGFNLINAHAYAKLPLTHNTELQLSTRRSITDLIVTPTYNQYFKRVFQDSDLSNNAKSNDIISQNEKFSFYDITAKFLYDISKKDKVRLHFMNINNSLNYEEQSTINNRSEALNSSLSQQNFAYGLTYIRDWSNIFSTRAQFYVTNYDLDATNFDIVNNQRLIQENEVFDGSARLDVDYKPNHNFKFNLGYQFSEIGISNLEDVNNPNFRSFVRDVVRSHSVYAESAFLSTNAKTRLNIGARINHIDISDDILIEPRLNFSQRFLNVFRFELLGEFKSQTASQIIDLQNDFLGIEKRRWVLATERTETEIVNEKSLFPVPIVKSKQASAGIHFNKNKILISAEAFIKKVDGITTRSQGFQNQYQFTYATGSYEIKGIDVLINKQFQDVVSTWLGYSYSINNYTFPTLNNGQPFPNNADIRHSLTFAGTYTYRDFKLAAGFNWFSGRPTTLPTFEQNENDTRINYASPNASRLEDYMRADVSATYNFNLSEGIRAVIGTSLWNVLNKQNILNRYYILNENNNVTPIENISLGLTPNVSFRVVF